MHDYDPDHSNEPLPRNWAGAAELDLALAQNRLTAYRVRKAWADPLARSMLLITIGSVGCVFGYLTLT